MNCGRQQRKGRVGREFILWSVNLAKHVMVKSGQDNSMV